VEWVSSEAGKLWVVGSLCTRQGTIEGFCNNIVQTFEGNTHDAAQRIVEFPDLDLISLNLMGSASGC
jgi:hypothetical protein